MDDKSSKNIALLAGLLSQPNAELLKKIDLENMELGEFVKQYFSTPATVDLSTRSSIREDTVINELSTLLLNNPDEKICVLDACCGIGNLAKRIAQAMGDGIQRIAYLAVDEHPASVRTIRSQEGEFSDFESFKVMQRQISDLGDLPSGSIDLLVLNNALHELQPRLFPEMFSTFNSLINPNRGLICVIDMEDLPSDQPESIAITWKGSDVEKFLKAAGLPVVVSVHPKLTNVYQAQVKHAKEGVQRDQMHQDIRTLLQEKLQEAITRRQRLTAAPFSNPAMIREWVVLTGTIARYSEELFALG